MKFGASAIRFLLVFALVGTEVPLQHAGTTTSISNQSVFADQALINGSVPFLWSYSRVTKIKITCLLARTKNRFISAPLKETPVFLAMDSGTEIADMHLNSGREESARTFGGELVQRSSSLGQFLSYLQWISGKILGVPDADAALRLGFLLGLWTPVLVHALWNLTPYPLVLTLKQVQPGEIRLTKGEGPFGERFSGRAQHYAKRMIDILTAAGFSNEKESFEYKGLVFIRRLSGAKKVVVLAHGTLDKLEIAFEMEGGRFSDNVPVGFQRPNGKEIGVSGKSLEKYFRGVNELSGRISAAIQVELQKGDPDRKELTVSGIKFHLRFAENNKPAWTFHVTQLSQVAKQFKGELLSELEYEIASDTDVTFSSNLSDHFIGDYKKLRKILEKKLPKGNEKNAVVGGVTFTRKLSSNALIWSFSLADIEKVAEHFKFELQKNRAPDFDPNVDVAVTAPGLGDHYIGHKATNQIKVQAAIEAALQVALVEAKKISEFPDKVDAGSIKEVWIENTPEKPADKIRVRVYRRTRAGHTIWAFAVKDVSKVSKIFTLKQKPEGYKNISKATEADICVSEPVFNEIFFGKAADHLAKVHALLKNVPSTQLSTTQKGIHFYKRLKGTQPYWHFAATDIDKFCEAFGLEVVQDVHSRKVQPDEIAITQAVFEPLFLGGTTKPAPIRKKLDALGGKEAEFEAFGIRFFRCRVGNDMTWSFKEENLELFAKTFGLTLRRDAPVRTTTTDMPLSHRILNDTYYGDAGRIHGMIHGWINERAEGKENVTLEGIQFVQKFIGSVSTWTISWNDEPKLRAIFKLTRLVDLGLDELHDDEIRFNEPGLKRWFEGISRRREPEPFLELEAAAGEQFDFIHKGVRFVKRFLSGAIVWAFNELDLGNVATIFGFKARTDAAVLIEELKLEEAVALLGEDPLRLKQYVQLYHPELAPEDVDSIAVLGSMRGFGGVPEEKEYLPHGFSPTLPTPEITHTLTELSTDGHAFRLEGKTKPGVAYIQVTGSYHRKIIVRKDGTFSATLPIPKVAEENTYFFHPVKPDTKEIGEPAVLTIQQTGTKEDVEDAFLRLLSLKEEVLESINVNSGRYYFLLGTLEQSLLRRFTQSEEEGFDYLSEKIRTEKSKALKGLLKAVESNFEDIAEQSKSWKIQKGEKLYFFQKYTVARALRVMEKPDPVTEQMAKGVIIANEQGLGKTVTALVIINGKPTVIIAPNGVVSTWLEQEEKFIAETNLGVLEGSYAERDEALGNFEKPQVVISVEFTQSMTPERAANLSKMAERLLVDEADYLGRTGSQQSRGTRMIQAGFRILLTATPFKKTSQIGNLLSFIYPDDPRFTSAKAFARAFPADNVNVLNALFLLMQRHMIRIRKKDVFENYDRSQPLTDQSDRLPQKVEVAPSEYGHFTLAREQSESIRELFTDYQGWCKKHMQQITEKLTSATEEDRRYKRFKEGFFPKLQALRQIMNDPRYIGLHIDSPKHKEMQRIVDKELQEDPNHKVIIFCKYVAEVEHYMKQFAEYGALGYYGDLPKDSNGYKIDGNGNREYYEIDEYENFILKDGKPVMTTKKKGLPIRALDYQRLVFQNDPNSRVLIATYETGSVGVTLTAAHAVIDDDLATTYRDQYQSDDRAHRIDNQRKKYEVRYYRMQATYGQEFLDTLEEEIRQNYFDMGTYDQVHYENLRSQARVFHRIMDGVGDEQELVGIQQKLLKNRMPFLFKTGEVAEVGEDEDSLERSIDDEEAGEGDEQLGLSGLWQPVVEWLTQKGWTSTQIGFLLGGAEELLVSGVVLSALVGLQTFVWLIPVTSALVYGTIAVSFVWLLSHVAGMYVRTEAGILKIVNPSGKHFAELVLSRVILAAALLSSSGLKGFIGTVLLITVAHALVDGFGIHQLFTLPKALLRSV